MLIPLVQVHIKQAGTARMLINTSDLPGVNKEVLAFADREKKFSKPSERNKQLAQHS